MKLRQLNSIDDYRHVYELEQSIWGYASAEDAVPVPIMIVTQKIGGLLLGAFDDDNRLVGFAYSMPGIREGQPFQWSHMLGVVEAHRNKGTGWLLKLEQRRVTLDRGLDLIEWTFDPLQALNAHLNFVKLGAIAREYQPDVYGESSSPLHRGTSTDRFIAEWWLRSARVEKRLEATARRMSHTGVGQSSGETGVGEGAGATGVGQRSSGSGVGQSSGATGVGQSSGATGVGQSSSFAGPVINDVRPHGEWLEPVGADLSIAEDRVGVQIPMGFTEMQQRDLSLARAWRATTREIFTTYLSLGYEVVDFLLERPERRGTYVMARRSDRSDTRPAG